MIGIPSSLLKSLLGSDYSTKFYTILSVLLLAGLVIRALINNQQRNNWMEKAQRKNNTRFNYLYGNLINNQSDAPKDQKSKNGRKWYSTGWVWNEETKLWDPPDYIHAEAKDKWEWDEEKAIWVDLDKKRRLERYQQFRKEAGKGPTYEEWKAQRLKEEQENKEPQ